MGSTINKGLVELSNALYGTISNDWSDHPDEAIWETPYWRFTKPNWYKAFYGVKNPNKFFYVPGFTMPPAGKITKKWTGFGIGTPYEYSGTLTPKPGAGQYQFYYGGNPAKSISGDPRALYCLDHLMRISGLKELHHAGMLPKVQAGAGTKGDFGHLSGCGIDLTRPAETNALIEAARVAHMPLMWISRTRVPGKGWPVFVLAESKKVGPLFHTSVNHDSHEHLVLPRPNWTSKYF